MNQAVASFNFTHALLRIRMRDKNFRLVYLGFAICTPTGDVCAMRKRLLPIDAIPTEALNSHLAVN
jgi:hypothetical protein